MLKIVLGIILFSLFTGTAHAQVNFGEPAQQIVKITIDENGDAHVTHVVEPSKKSRQLQVIRSDFVNLAISDEDGGSPQYAEAGTDPPGFLIFPTKNKVLVEYDLKKAVTQKDGMWSWNYYYLATSQFFLPDQVEIVFLNENPLYFAGHQGISCHGCQVKLEYELKPKLTTKQIQWSDKKFDLKIITRTNIKSINFDQPKNTISFDVEKPNQYITLVIPLELLWNPYEVFLNGEKIEKHEFYNDGINIWLNFKPKQTGTIEIMGVSSVPEFPITALLIFGAAMIFVTKFSRFNLH